MKPTYIAWDVELHSHYNLSEGDAWMYSRHPTTGFNSMVFNWCGKEKHPPGASPSYLLLDYHDCTDARKLAKAKAIIDDPNVILVMHNAAFELYCAENILGWKIPPEKVICTMAKAGYYHLPQSLDKCAQALGLSQLKDTGKGSKAMKELMHADAHGKHITPDMKPELFQQLYAYNIQDTVVTLGIHNALPNVPADEKRVWNMHIEINRRGIPFDWFLVQNAQKLIIEETAALDATTWMLTDGKVNSTRQVKELAAWFSKRVGRISASVAKGEIDELEKLLPPGKEFDDVRQVIDIRRQIGLTSIAKFAAMNESMDTDCRIRDSYWYYGGHPGRWSGKGVQPQNLVHQFDGELCEALSESDMPFIRAMYEKPLVALQGAVRGAVYAGEDHTFLGVDLRQIEARAAAWIGGDQKTLDLYAKGEDVYCSTAGKLYGRVITKDEHPLERDTGKRVELLCQFGGGIGGLERTFKKNGVDIGGLTAGISVTSAEADAAAGGLRWYYDQGKGTLPEDQALAIEALKLRWRKAHPEIVAKWGELERGFIAGIYDDGKIKIASTAKGSRVITLAGGRQLFYRDVRCSGGTISYVGRWGSREETYGASIFQNVVQATDRDIICWYMLKIDAVKLPILLHTHDEYMIRVHDEKLAAARKKIDEIHHTYPPFSGGLPIDFEIWTDKRYAK
jgi:DNA polymerase bacteriophage-type